MLEKIYIKKAQREFMCANTEKNRIVIKNVIESEDTLMHKAERPTNHSLHLLHKYSG